MVTAAAVQAHATSITRIFQFSASGFTTIESPPPPPFSTLVGSVTVTWDPTLPVTIIDQTSNITLNSLNIPMPTTIAFTYNPFFFNTMQIGGLINGASNVVAATDDFIIQFRNADTTPNTFFSRYTTSTTGQDGLYQATTVNVSVVPEPSNPIPEPSTMILLGSGLAGLGFFRRRKSEKHRIRQYSNHSPR